MTKESSFGHDLVKSSVSKLLEQGNEEEVMQYFKVFQTGQDTYWNRKSFFSDCYVFYPDYITGLIEVLKEIYPDLAMIQATSMGLDDYLLHFACFQTDTLAQPSNMEYRLLSLRLGSIFHHFPESFDQEKFEKVIDNFKTRFPLFLKYSGLGSENSFDSNESLSLAERWAGFFEIVRQYYEETYSLYSYLIEKAVGMAKGYNDLDKISFHKIYKEFWACFDNQMDDKEIPKKIFCLNIRLIHILQNQRPLEDISKSLKGNWSADTSQSHHLTPGQVSFNPRLPTNSEKETTEYLYNIDDLFMLLRKMIHRLEQNHEKIFKEPFHSGEIWYRGVANSAYHILPSLFVKYSQLATFDANKQRLSKTPYEILVHLFQQFKFRSDGAPEIYREGPLQSSDYLALMQHYGVPTTLLDWSEDIFASLFFALEHYMKSDKDEKDFEDKDAVLYIFDPAAYNQMRRLTIANHMKCMEDGHISCTTCKNRYCSEYGEAVQKTLHENLDIVPNISISLSRNIFDFMFLEKNSILPFDPLYLKKEKLSGSTIINCSPLCFNLPTAVYTSRLNPRIRAQSGQFLVYQPYTQPIINSGKLEASCFDYVALDLLQKEWLKSNDDNKPFLLKLIISKNIKKDLGKQLGHFGISKKNYYPELNNTSFLL